MSRLRARLHPAVASLVAVFGFSFPCTAGLAPGAALDLESNLGVTSDPTTHLVSSWADQSGNGHDATMGSVSAQPTFATNVFNGLGGLHFDGSSDFLSIAGQVLTSQQFSIFAVVTDESGSTGFREIISNWSFSNDVSSVFLGNQDQNPTTVRFTDNYGGGDEGNAGVGPLSDPSSPFVLSAFSNTDSASVSQDENLVGSRNTPLTTRNLTTPYVLGRQGETGEFWQGYMGAIVVYDRQLTADESLETTRYLETKYLGMTFATPEPGTTVSATLGALIFGAAYLRRRRATVGQK